jgi:hypothetical protein
MHCLQLSFSHHEIHSLLFHSDIKRSCLDLTSGYNLKYTETCFLIHKTHEEVTVGMFSVPARISKGQGAGPEKGSLVRCWIFKKGIFLGTL